MGEYIGDWYIVGFIYRGIRGIVETSVEILGDGRTSRTIWLRNTCAGKSRCFACGCQLSTASKSHSFTSRSFDDEISEREAKSEKIEHLEFRLQ